MKAPLVQTANMSPGRAVELSWPLILNCYLLPGEVDRFPKPEEFHHNCSHQTDLRRPYYGEAGEEVGGGEAADPALQQTAGRAGPLRPPARHTAALRSLGGATVHRDLQVPTSLLDVGGQLHQGETGGLPLQDCRPHLHTTCKLRKQG